MIAISESPAMIEGILTTITALRSVLTRWKSARPKFDRADMCESQQTNQRCG